MSDLLSAALSESGLDEFLRDESSVLTLPSSSIESNKDGYLNDIDYIENEEIVITQPENEQVQKFKLLNSSSLDSSQVSQQYYTPSSFQQTNKSTILQNSKNRVHLIQNNNDNRLPRPIITHQQTLPNIRLLQNSTKNQVDNNIGQKFIKQQLNNLTHSIPSTTHTRVIQVPAGYRLVSTASLSASTPLKTRDILVRQKHNNKNLNNGSVNHLRNIQRISAPVNSRLLTTESHSGLNNHYAAARGNFIGSNLRSGYYPSGIKTKPLISNTNNKSIGGFVGDTMLKKVLYRQNIPLYATSPQQNQQHNVLNYNHRVHCANNRLIPSISSSQFLPNYKTRPTSPIRPPSVPPPELQPQSPVGSPTASPTPVLPHTQLIQLNQPLKQVCRNVSPAQVSTTYINNETIMKNPIKSDFKNLNNTFSELNKKNCLNKLTEEDEIEQIQVDTYVEYFPPKLRSGLAHPDSVVETVSLSSVSSPEILYHMSIPEEIVDMGQISALQLEASVYACQAHEKRLPSGERLGYLIGDGAGVGKGRIIATIIYENYLLGRKRAVWLSVSSDLKFDAERDLKDIGASHIDVYSLNKLKYAKINGVENNHIKKGVIFSTYASLIGECRSAQNLTYSSRLKQVLQWCGKDFDGVIVFDECHRAKNLCPSSGTKSTKTGKFVLELQRALPSARIVYASATGATEPRNMAYMTRLGLWGQGQTFETFNDFIHAVENRGVGAMEMVAMDMKLRGLYLARQLSFKGVGFRVTEVELTPDFIRVYDESVKVWMECRRQFSKALNHMPQEMSKNQKVWAQFWSAHQRFFKYLCISAKVQTCVKIALNAIAEGKCVVIGLQSTGEAQMLDYIEDNGEVTEFVSTAKAVLQGLIEKHFPTYDDNRINAMNNFERMFLSMDDMTKSESRKRKRQNNLLNKKHRKRAVSFESDKLSAERESGGNSDNEINFESDECVFDDENDEEFNKIENDDDDDGGDDNDDDDDDNSDDADEENDEFNKSNATEDLVNEMMAQLSSDDESDENIKQNYHQNLNDNINNSNQRTRIDSNNGLVEINPFCMDLTQEDPWAKNQKTCDELQKNNDNKLSVKNLEKKRKIKKAKRIKTATQPKASASALSQASAVEFINATKLLSDSQDDDEIVDLAEIKSDLLNAVENLGKLLPSNTLDQLINQLGGPNYVAEMTGRRGRVITKEDTGKVQYELRNADSDAPVECMNMEEKEKFMNGEKLVAIISEAASSGISLQSDRRANNRRRRVHITLELPWSADKAIQQFGRTHRSNQVSAPEYLFLISELAGEKRFASIVAKRLESLGALTHGDRRATETRDLSQFNIDTKYGREALEILFKTIIGSMAPIVPIPSAYKAGDFFADMQVFMEGVGLLYKPTKNVYAIEREAICIPKFLNRLLGLPAYAQNSLFQYFSDIVAELIKQAKFDGTYDMGIMDIGVGSDRVQKTETRKFVGSMNTNDFHVEMHKISLHRGINWDEALSLVKLHNGINDGFYVSTIGFKKKISVALIYGIGKPYDGRNHRFYSITRPNTGRSPKFEPLNEILQRFRPISIEEAKKFWIEQYEKLDQQCHHRFYHGKCNNELAGRFCEVGRRTRTYFVLSGSVICVWPALEEILAEGKNKNKRMQIVRVRTDNNQKVIGLLVLPIHVRKLVELLEQRCKK